MIDYFEFGIVVDWTRISRSICSKIATHTPQSYIHLEKLKKVEENILLSVGSKEFWAESSIEHFFYFSQMPLRFHYFSKMPFDLTAGERQRCAAFLCLDAIPCLPQTSLLPSEFKASLSGSPSPFLWKRGRTRA